jgi:hypothetical protein
MKEAAPYAAALVRLLKGPLYSDSGEAWDLLLRYRSQVEDWFADIALEVVVAEHDGLAFVRRRRDQGSALGDAENERTRESSGAAVPELVARRELPYKTSLLCVLLVEELHRFEAGSSDESRLVLDRARIRDLILPYLPRKTNEAKQADEIDAQLGKLEQYGFLRRLGPDSDEFEVMKLLKHKIDAGALAESLERLTAHVKGADSRTGEGDE